MRTRIVAFITAKGGTGKSTAAINFGVAAMEAGEQVLMLDMAEPYTVTEWAKIRQSEPPTVAHLPPNETTRLSDLLAAARERFTLVVIDTPGKDSPMTHNAMNAADLCIVPLRPTRIDGLGVKPTAEALIRGKKHFAFMLTQCPPAHGTRAAEMAAGLQTLGILAEPLVASRADYQDAYAAGQGVTEYAPHGKAAAEMRKLWEWVDRMTESPSSTVDALLKPARQIGSAA